MGCKMDKLICHNNARALRANVNRILCLLELKMTIKCTNGTIVTHTVHSKQKVSKPKSQ